jgi:hypothetical protein
MSEPPTPQAGLRGRAREQEVLDRLLLDVRDGHSRVLVLRGETGVGKTALLSYLADRATPGRVVRTSGAATEPGMAYAALKQVCAPLLDKLGRLPAVQRAALSAALGLDDGAQPAHLLVGLAALGLFAAAAADEPLVCVVDDAQLLDGLSAAILAFVARRLDAGPVALVFAVDTSAPAAAEQSQRGPLAGLPELRVEGPGADGLRALSAQASSRSQLSADRAGIASGHQHTAGSGPHQVAHPVRRMPAWRLTGWISPASPR